MLEYPLVDYIYFNIDQCVIESNSQEFLKNRIFPKDNSIEQLGVEWDEDWRKENEGITNPSFTKFFETIESASSLIFMLMAGFTDSRKMNESEFDYGDKMENYEGEFTFIKVSRIRLKIDFNKGDV